MSLGSIRPPVSKCALPISPMSITSAIRSRGVSFWKPSSVSYFPIEFFRELKTWPILWEASFLCRRAMKSLP